MCIITVNIPCKLLMFFCEKPCGILCLVYTGDTVKKQTNSGLHDCLYNSGNTKRGIYMFTITIKKTALATIPHFTFKLGAKTIDSMKNVVMLPNNKPLFVFKLKLTKKRQNCHGLKMFKCAIKRYVNLLAYETTEQQSLLMYIASANIVASICKAQYNRVVGKANISESDGLKFWQNIASQTMCVYCKRRDTAIESAVRLTKNATKLWNSDKLMSYLTRFHSNDIEVDEMREQAYCSMYSEILNNNIVSAYKLADTAVNAYIYSNKRIETTERSYDTKGKNEIDYLSLADCVALTKYSEKLNIENGCVKQLANAITEARKKLKKETNEIYFPLLLDGLSSRELAKTVVVSQTTAVRKVHEIRKTITEQLPTELVERLLKN